jgi:hypothetical protein
LRCFWGSSTEVGDLPALARWLNCSVFKERLPWRGPGTGSGQADTLVRRPRGLAAVRVRSLKTGANCPTGGG